MGQNSSLPQLVRSVSQVLMPDIIDPKIADHKGRIVKTTGDGILVEFPSVVGAVACAVAFQREVAQQNVPVPQDHRIEFRVGINLGDVIVEDDDTHGDGVNVAARLEALAGPGGPCVSGIVNDQVQGRLEVGFEDTGEQSLKNIVRPVRVFQAQLGGARATAEAARPALALPDKPSIAVLPFQNMSGDPEQEYFADGLVEDSLRERNPRAAGGRSAAYGDLIGQRLWRWLGWAVLSRVDCRPSPRIGRCHLPPVECWRA
jgi:adenylate cyclase